jgi:hypothetical protein
MDPPPAAPDLRTSTVQQRQHTPLPQDHSDSSTTDGEAAEDQKAFVVFN